MIRTSFCTIAFQKNKWGRDRTVEAPLVEILPVVAEAGYDGVEIWGPHVADLDEKGLQAVESALQADGLAVAMVSPYFDFTTDGDRAAASVAEGRALVPPARRLGSRGIRCFTGRVGSEEATEEQWVRTVACLRDLADGAPDLLWALETHDRNLVDTIPAALRLVEEVDRANVRLIFQPGTFPEAYMEACRALAPVSCHVHATNRAGGGRSGLEAGDMDYGAVFACLAEADFDGFVSVEWMGEDPAGAARREGPYLKRLAAETARKGAS